MSDTEVKETEAIQQEEITAKEEVKEAPKNAKKRPNKKRKKKADPKVKKPEIFSDTIGAKYPDLAKKFQKSRDELIKKQISEAQKDPKVQEASKKFASKNKK